MNNKKYQKEEKMIQKAKEHNKEILIDFENYLKTKSLKSKTIKKHISNIDFFANSYLLHYEITPIEEGFSEIGGFLGDYFIRKTTWASKTTIQENIVSFKKFYTFLYEIGKISKDDLNEMKEFIKENKEYWIKELEDYWNDTEDDLVGDWL